MTYTIYSHNKTETAATLEEAKRLAGRRAKSYAEARGLKAVWGGPQNWSSDDGEMSHGGYAVVNKHGNDVAEGAAVIVSKGRRSNPPTGAASNPPIVKLTKADRAAIDAFIDGKAHRGGKKLESTGTRLNGLWLGGDGIAYWQGDRIHFRDAGGRAAQSIQRIVKRETPKNYLSPAAQRGVASNPIKEKSQNPGALKRSLMR